MSELFLEIINMSISASWLVLAVLIARTVLKKAPKWVNVLLWGIVAVRLICPFSFESELSLIPSAETFPDEVLSGPNFDIQTGIAPVDNQINNYLGDRYFESVTVPANNGFDVMTALAIVWGIGILLLLAYVVISYWRLHCKLNTAVRFRDNIFQSENVSSPFVLGIIKPKIFVPFKMNGQHMEHVVAHEQAHVHRKDHLWKPLGFLLLTIHWFNPLMWLAYILLCRDIELACDEKVIKELGNEQRAHYIRALVACSMNRRIIAACPLAFGEIDVIQRVKSVMNYKKPAVWIVVVSIIICAVVAICFLSNPINRNDDALEAYASFLSGDRTVLNSSQTETWWIPDFQDKDMKYEYTYIDLDGDEVVELLIQLVDDPSGYNGVFHFENGELLCWNSDGIEMSHRDYPLMDGTMVRQYDYNGTRSYTVFRYLSNGEVEKIASIFAREELIYPNSTEPCPYYTVNGNVVEKDAFDEQLNDMVTSRMLSRSAWTEN